jgi:hypothetical protein
MSKFFNTSRGPVTATIGKQVVCFPGKQWTTLADDIEMSASLKSLLAQGTLIPEVASKPLVAAKSSKDKVAPKPPAKPEAKPAPKPAPKPEVRMEVKAADDVKPAPKPKDADALLTSDKK